MRSKQEAIHHSRMPEIDCFSFHKWKKRQKFWIRNCKMWFRPRAKWRFWQHELGPQQRQYLELKCSDCSTCNDKETTSSLYHAEGTSLHDTISATRVSFTPSFYPSKSRWSSRQTQIQELAWAWHLRVQSIHFTSTWKWTFMETSVLERTHNEPARAMDIL